MGLLHLRNFLLHLRTYCFSANRVKKDLFVILFSSSILSFLSYLVIAPLFGRTSVLNVSDFSQLRDFVFKYILCWLFIIFLILYLLGLVNTYNEKNNISTRYPFRLSYIFLSFWFLFFISLFLFILKVYPFLMSPTSCYTSDTVFGLELHKLVLVDQNNQYYLQVKNLLQPFGHNHGFFSFPRFPLNEYLRSEYDYYLANEYDVLVERIEHEKRLRAEKEYLEALEKQKKIIRYTYIAIWLTLLIYTKLKEFSNCIF